MKTSFEYEYRRAALSPPLSDEYIEQLLAHSEEGVIGETAAGCLLREVLRLRQPPAKTDPSNCTFHSFKKSGKWYATGRGIAPRKLFIDNAVEDRRRYILEVNGGKFPGLSSQGSREFVWVVIPDDSADGFPLMLSPGV